MIYLNHAGTSWPKPPPVVAAAESVFAADPLTWPELFAGAHRQVADFFHVEPSRLLLTPSCTAAIQLAVQDLPWQPGDRALTSHFEHHATMRSLAKLEQRGVNVTILPFSENEPLELDSLKAELMRGGVRLLAITAACNVTGQLLPIAEAIELAHQFGSLVLIDGAQTAGWWDLDLIRLNADLFTFAGHKGPQAPWGIGGLFVRPEVAMQCPTATCEITNQRDTPATAMPGYCDAGSVNLPALAGLAAACDWLRTPAMQARLATARELARSFANAIRSLPGVTLYHDSDLEQKVPTIAMSVEGVASGELASRLRDRGVIASGGFQCAPQAHRALGTSESGVVRFSFGPSSRANDVNQATTALSDLVSAN